MKEENELLRSAYQIAERKGVDTNWDAFLTNLQRELIKQAGIPVELLNQEPTTATAAQLILRATCTARTYRIRSGE